MELVTEVGSWGEPRGPKGVPRGMSDTRCTRAATTARNHVEKRAEEMWHSRLRARTEKAGDVSNDGRRGDSGENVGAGRAELAAERPQVAERASGEEVLGWLRDARLNC